MGNYPYPSSYILNGNGLLPAYPVRVACDSLAQPDLAGPELLSSFADAVGVFYNYTRTLSCFDFRGGVNNATTEVGVGGGGGGGCAAALMSS
jgi:lysosomal Pro-X carboxypeptidase